MSKLQILVGCIAVGKSFYSRKAAESGIICLNDDSIVTMLHGGNYTRYDKGLKVLYKAIEHTIIEIGVALNKTILIDRGLNISREARKRYIAIANSFDVECEALWFENKGPEIHAENRFNSDSRGHSFQYWLKVAKFHDSVFQIPNLDEGFNRVIKLERDCEVYL